MTNDTARDLARDVATLLTAAAAVVEEHRNDRTLDMVYMPVSIRKYAVTTYGLTGAWRHLASPTVLALEKALLALQEK